MTDTPETQDEATWVSRTGTGSRRRPAAPEQAAEVPISVATYNVRNLHPGVGDPDPRNNDRLDRLAKSIIENLDSPDIIALQEVQDNDGPEDSGITAADETLQELIDAIVAQGGPGYVYTEVAPRDFADGGQPGGNIRQAFLFKPEKVSLHPSTGGVGEHDEHVGIETGNDGRVHLDHNPARIHPEYAAFNESRKPLIAEFVEHETGESLFITNVHLISRRGDPKVRDELRSIQAGAIAQFYQELKGELEANEQDVNFMVVGDFNTEHTEHPVRLLANQDGMKLLDQGLTDGSYYTYVYKGQKLDIDHVIATNDLSNRKEAQAHRINAGKSRSRSASDHNPVDITVDLGRGNEGKSGGAARG